MNSLSKMSNFLLPTAVKTFVMNDWDNNIKKTAWNQQTAKFEYKCTCTLFPSQAETVHLSWKHLLLKWSLSWLRVGSKICRQACYFSFVLSKAGEKSTAKRKISWHLLPFGFIEHVHNSKASWETERKQTEQQKSCVCLCCKFSQNIAPIKEPWFFPDQKEASLISGNVPYLKKCGAKLFSQRFSELSWRLSCLPTHGMQWYIERAGP